MRCISAVNCMFSSCFWKTLHAVGRQPFQSLANSLCQTCVTPVVAAPTFSTRVLTFQDMLVNKGFLQFSLPRSQHAKGGSSFRPQARIHHSCQLHSWSNKETRSKTSIHSATSSEAIMEPEVEELITAIHKTKTQAVLYTTGGGSQAPSWLLAVPGASNTILEVVVPYSRDSLVDILGQEPPQGQFCSEATAQAMAQAAYRRAAELSQLGTPIVGLGVTCALAAVPMKRGEHRAHLACHSSQGTATLSLSLAKGARGRAGEDTLVSKAVVQVLGQACGLDTSHVKLGLIAPASASASSNAPSAATCASASTSASTPLVPAPQQPHISSAAPQTQTQTQPQPHQPPDSPTPPPPPHDALHSAHLGVGLDPIEELLAGRVRCVEFAGGQVVVDAPRRRRVYLPGSFNPLHEGHKAMLEAAVRQHGHGMEGCFELAVGNADKGQLSAPEVRRRVAQFTSAGLPLLLTSRPLFTQKAALLPGSAFVVGHDTAIRLVQPKYYGDGSRAALLLEFEGFRHRGCRFIVAGRQDKASGSFLGLGDVEMDPGLVDLFLGLPEGAFRLDISSTEIRERQARQRQAEGA